MDVFRINSEYIEMYLTGEHMMPKPGGAEGQWVQAPSPPYI